MQQRAHNLRLTVFVVRHVIGIGLFAWLVVQSFRADAATFGYILAALGAVYAAFAVWSGMRLAKMPQRGSKSAK